MSVALWILIASFTAAAIALSIGGVGIYRFAVAWRKGQESFW